MQKTIYSLPALWRCGNSWKPPTGTTWSLARDRGSPATAATNSTGSRSRSSGIRVAERQSVRKTITLGIDTGTNCPVKVSFPVILSTRNEVTESLFVLRAYMKFPEGSSAMSKG